MDLFSKPAEISYARHESFFKNTYFIFPCSILLPLLRCALNYNQATEHALPAAFYSWAVLGFQFQFL